MPTALDDHVLCCHGAAGIHVANKITKYRESTEENRGQGIAKLVDAPTKRDRKFYFCAFHLSSSVLDNAMHIFELGTAPYVACLAQILVSW